MSQATLRGRRPAGFETGPALCHNHLAMTSLPEDSQVLYSSVRIFHSTQQVSTLIHAAV